MQTPNLSALDMLTAARAKAALKGTKNDGGFKDLFDEALAIAEKPAKKPEAPKQEATEPTPNDAALASAAATAASPAPEVIPENETAPAQTGTGADSGSEATVTTTIAAAQQKATVAAATTATQAKAILATPATPGGDILSMELAGVAATTQSPAEQPALPGQIATARAETSKLGKMLGQAQQQLQQMNVTAETGEAAAPTTPVTPVATTPTAPVSEPPTEPAPTAPTVPTAPTTPAAPAVPTAPSAENPTDEAAIPPVTGEEAIPDDTPVDTGATDEVAPPDEADATPTTTPSRNPAAEAKATEQRPLNAMPETDRAVMNMREQTDARQRVEPVKAEETAAAASGTQQTAQPQQTQQTGTIRQAEQPQREAPAAPDQAEQIRLQVSENLKSGRTEFRMQLAPEELGKISVKLVMEGGRLAVEIVTSGARTAELLGRQAEALGMALKSHTGMDVTSVNVVSEAGNASGSMYSPFGMNSGADGGDFRGQQNHQNGRQNADAQNDDDPAFAEAKEEPETLLNRMI